jgi:hypothetical protein
VPHRVGARWSLRLSVALLAAASVVIASGLGYIGPAAIAGLAVTGVAIAAVLAAAAKRPAEPVAVTPALDSADPPQPEPPSGADHVEPPAVGRVAFRIVLAVAVADVALLVAAGPNLA